jgi:uncharacterized membrane protein
MKKWQTYLLLLTLSNILSIHSKWSAIPATIFWILIIMPLLGNLFCIRFIKSLRPKSDNIVFYYGLGLGIYLIAGCLANSLSALLHIHVFSSTPLCLLMIDAIYLVLIYLSRNTLTKKEDFALIQFTYKHLLGFLILLLIPVTAVMGAERLNNGASDTFSLFTLIVILIAQIYYISKRKNADSRMYLTVLFSFSLALVLGVSMRSHYLMGSDINQEFQVFQGTLNHGYWTPNLFPKSDYNACLSITILPAFLSGLIHISNLYMYKFTMQFILALTPLVVFIIAKKILNNKRYAFVSALFYIIQAQFIIQFPALLRQQVAMLFFGLMFASIINDDLSQKSKKALIMTFGILMIVSHYSTAYIAIAVLALVTLAKLLMSFNDKYKTVLHIPGFSVIAILILVMFAWNYQFISGSGNLVSKVSQSFLNINEIFSDQSHSSFVTTTFSLGSPTYNTQLLKKYGYTTRAGDGYSNAGNYTPVPLSSDGPNLNTGIKQFEYKAIQTYIPAMIKIIFIIGAGSLIIQVKRQQKINSEYVYWLLAGSVLFIALALLPNLSIDYNLERLYQQLLVLISCSIAGFLLVLDKLFNKYKFNYAISIFCLLIVAYYACTSGIANELSFRYSSINLSNKGNYFDEYYITANEYNGIRWVAKNSESTSFDRYTILRDYSYGDAARFKPNLGVMPSEVKKTNFVFSGSTNTVKGFAFGFYKNQVVTFNFPTIFFSDSKSIVYTNGETKVYR